MGLFLQPGIEGLDSQLFEIFGVPGNKNGSLKVCSGGDQTIQYRQGVAGFRSMSAQFSPFQGGFYVHRKGLMPETLLKLIKPGDQVIPLFSDLVFYHQSD